LPSASAGRPFIQGGPGLYDSSTSGEDFGFNLGVGWHLPQGDDLELEWGLDYHRVTAPDDPWFLVAHFGVLF
jgi:hypothetical protein